MPKIITTFVLSFLASFLLMKTFIREMNIRREILDREQANIIQQQIKERFELFLEIPLAVGRMSAGYLTLNGHRSKDDYGRLVEQVFENRDEFLGLNLLDTEGKIINIFPKRANKNAIGKVTQNVAALKAAFAAGFEYWFSPPFELYQGGKGFVFYIPLIENGKLRGWIAPVIRCDRFFEIFRNMAFFRTYELVVRDAQSEKFYFASALEPNRDLPVYEKRDRIMGRDLIFQSWRKRNELPFLFPWYWPFLISTIIASLAALGMRFHLQKKKAGTQLENIGKLLHLTAKEALANLVDIHSEYNTLGSSGYIRTSVVKKDVHYITNLIEQIDLLQTMAASEGLEVETFKVLPIIREQLENVDDIIKKKNLKLILNEVELEGLTVTGNKWLFTNGVLKNAITHALLYTVVDHSISIRSDRSGKLLEIHLEKILSEEANTAFRLERRILVAKNSAALIGANLTLSHDASDGMIVAITFQKE